MNEVQPKDIVLKAKELIETVGWVQGRYEQFINGECVGYCLSGALGTAAMGSYTNTLCAARLEVQSLVGIDIPIWNDDPARTKEDVIRVLTEAAK